MTATRNGLSSRWTTISLVLMALAWLVAAPLLWRSQVPGDLDLPNLDPRDYFSAAELARAEHYERFLRIDTVLSLVATVIALLVLVRRAPRLARNTGLGPIGAGMIVGMITLAVVWAANLPFAIAARWWERAVRPRARALDRLVPRALGGARRRGRPRDAPDRDRDAVRPALPAALVAAGDADLRRADRSRHLRLALPARARRSTRRRARSCARTCRRSSSAKGSRAPRSTWRRSATSRPRRTRSRSASARRRES